MTTNLLRYMNNEYNVVWMKSTLRSGFDDTTRQNHSVRFHCMQPNSEWHQIAFIPEWYLLRIVLGHSNQQDMVADHHGLAYCPMINVCCMARPEAPRNWFYRRTKYMALLKMYYSGIFRISHAECVPIYCGFIVADDDYMCVHTDNRRTVKRKIHTHKQTESNRNG